MTNVDLSTKSGPQLLEIYNAEAAKLGLPTVKRFADTKTALRRTTAILAGEVKQVKDTKTKPAATPKGEGDGEGEAKKTAAPAPKPPAKAKGGERKTRGMRFVFPVEKEIKPVREGSKRYMALQLLSRENGATFEQVMEKTGWSRKDCYEGIRLLHYYSGYGMRQDENGRIFIKGKA